MNYKIWYTRNKTKVWGTVWFVLGLLGGNADRAVTYVQTIIENPQYIEQKIQLLDETAAEVKILKDRVDKLESAQYNKEAEKNKPPTIIKGS